MTGEGLTAAGWKGCYCRGLWGAQQALQQGSLVLIVAVARLCKVDQVDSPCLHLPIVCALRNIRTEMLRVAHNYKRLYEMYNFDYDPEPGSVQYKIDQRIKRVSKGN